MDNEAFKLKVALHLLPLSICLRGVYFMSVFQAIHMMAYPHTFRLFPLIAFVTAILLEWQAIDLLRKHNIVGGEKEDE